MSRLSGFRMFVHNLYIEYREERAIYNNYPVLSLQEWFRNFKYFIKRRYRDYEYTERRRQQWLDYQF